MTQCSYSETCRAPATHTQRQRMHWPLEYLCDRHADERRGFVETALEVTRRRLPVPITDETPEPVGSETLFGGCRMTPPISHGTREGFKRHLQRGEAPCDECAAMVPGCNGFATGSADGYREHLRRGEFSCGPCRDAFSVAYFAGVRERAFRRGQESAA